MLDPVKVQAFEDAAKVVGAKLGEVRTAITAVSDAKSEHENKANALKIAEDNLAAARQKRDALIADMHAAELVRREAFNDAFGDPNAKPSS